MASRTYHSIRNACWGLSNKFIVLFGQFLTRTIIIQVLGAEYLGLTTLLVSMLQILNLAELGFSNAVVYCLYKPVAENDLVSIKSLLLYYRKIYRLIGGIILLVGLAIAPFFEVFIDHKIPDSVDIYILYLLYLISTAVSYFLFAYKSAVITAAQRQDLISKAYLISQILQYTLQVIVLYMFKNLYSFVIVLIGCNVLNNIILQILSKKHYPEYFCEGHVNSSTKKKIKKLVGGIMIQRLCQTFRKSLSSIVLAGFVSLSVVAIYGNYDFILTVVISFCSVFTTALSSSIGNGVASNSIATNYKEMNMFVFGYSWISGLCFITLVCIYNPFMRLWMGSDLLFPNHMVYLFSIYFYCLSMGDIRALYHSAAGLWWNGKSVWLIESILNLVLCIIMGKFWGVEGILVATILTVLFINFGMGSQIVFRYYFKEFSILKYYFNHIKYFGVTLLLSFPLSHLCSLLPDTNYYYVGLRVVVCLLVANLLYYLLYRNTKGFIYFKQILFQRLFKH